jgi:Stage II sporulation protein E (SpoIIE)
VPRRREPVDRPVLRIDGTIGGRAFTETTTYEVDAGQEGRRRLWLALIDGTDRLGVVELTAPAPVTEQLLTYCERYAHLIAQLVVGKGVYGDVFELVRRRRPMTVAAELQWTLLPPLVFATRGLVVAGALEPCYTVGGDSFDYAVDDWTAHLAVFDAMGHGLAAAATAAVTVAAYRNARRQRLDLPGTYAMVDETLRAEFGGERFATGLLARLDLREGRLRWISAGHPPPLLLRGGKLVKVLELRPTTPLGVPFGQTPATLGDERLEPGDRVLLYTDGVVEARTATGEFFAYAGDPAPAPARDPRPPEGPAAGRRHRPARRVAQRHRKGPAAGDGRALTLRSRRGGSAWAGRPGS